MTNRSNVFATVSLISANLVPLFGVMYFGWNLFMILVLYWLENVVVGTYTILKMRIGKLPTNSPITFPGTSKTTKQFERKAYIAFFITHYGMFTAVHGMFVFTIFSNSIISPSEILVGLLFLFLSHGISYRTNFIDKREFEQSSLDRLMAAPYRRVLVMHLVVISGAFFVQIVGAPILALLTLVGLKTLIDFRSHNTEHKTAREGRL